MKKICLILFAVLSVVVFSCKDNLISTDFTSQNNQTGEIKVFVKQSRLIGPETTDINWTVELYQENDKFSGKNENDYYVFSGLSDGIYNVIVSGKLDDVEKFTGSAIAKIENGNSVKVNVPIVAQKKDKTAVALEERTGYATITMNMSDSLISLLNQMGEGANLNAYLSTDLNEYGNVTASLVNKIYDELQTVSVEILDNQKVEFQIETLDNRIFSSDIATGYYYLSFSSLEDYDYTIKLKDNLVEIGDGLTTNIVLTENDYELVQDSVVSQGESTVFYIDNSDNDHESVTTEPETTTTYAGTSLSNPLGFRNIDEDITGTFYLITDVKTYSKNETSNEESCIDSISGNTIASFSPDMFSIINNYNNNYFRFENTTLKNIKLTDIGGVGFCLANCVIDGSVILDSPIVQESGIDSVVYIGKTSNLVLGQNFSGELGICLSTEDWKLDDTVVTFENGIKPQNCNLYIYENLDMPTGYASTFYIDDNGNLAQYDATTQWVNFAWNAGVPCLITQTQAKNKTYTSVCDNECNSLYSFNGVSTYGENETWYFINNTYDENDNDVSTLYSVQAQKDYVGEVEASLIDLANSSVTLLDVTAMDYDAGKLYMACYLNSSIDFYCIDINNSNNSFSSSFTPTLKDASISNLTALLVDGENVYIATTLTDSTQSTQVTTHSAIWQLQLTSQIAANGTSYKLTPIYTYQYDSSTAYPVPYYLTSSDDFDGTIADSTFRITDLYSNDGSIYGLLANYVEKNGYDTRSPNVYMRGSVFKLITNSERGDGTSDPIMNATHYGLVNSFPLTSSELPTAKQYFVLPRKFVGVLNNKLVIVDDGMVPDSNDCSVDRFVLFDLSSEITETIDVPTIFSTNASTSDSKFFTNGALFDGV